MEASVADFPAVHRCMYVRVPGTGKGHNCNGEYRTTVSIRVPGTVTTVQSYRVPGNPGRYRYLLGVCIPVGMHMHMHCCRFFVLYRYPAYNCIVSGTQGANVPGIHTRIPVCIFVHCTIFTQLYNDPVTVATRYRGRYLDIYAGPEEICRNKNCATGSYKNCPRVLMPGLQQLYAYAYPVYRVPGYNCTGMHMHTIAHSQVMLSRAFGAPLGLCSYPYNCMHTIVGCLLCIIGPRNLYACLWYNCTR